MLILSAVYHDVSLQFMIYFIIAVLINIEAFSLYSFLLSSQLPPKGRGGTARRQGSAAILAVTVTTWTTASPCLT